MEETASTTRNPQMGRPTRPRIAPLNSSRNSATSPQRSPQWFWTQIYEAKTESTPIPAAQRPRSARPASTTANANRNHASFSAILLIHTIHGSCSRDQLQGRGSASSLSLISNSSPFLTGTWHTWQSQYFCNFGISVIELSLRHRNCFANGWNPRTAAPLNSSFAPSLVGGFSLIPLEQRPCSARTLKTD